MRPKTIISLRRFEHIIGILLLLLLLLVIFLSILLVPMPLLSISSLLMLVLMLVLMLSILLTAVCDLIYHIKNPRWCVIAEHNAPYLLWFVWSKFAV